MSVGLDGIAIALCSQFSDLAEDDAAREYAAAAIQDLFEDGDVTAADVSGVVAAVLSAPLPDIDARVAAMLRALGAAVGRPDIAALAGRERDDMSMTAGSARVASAAAAASGAGAASALARSLSAEEKRQLSDHGRRMFAEALAPRGSTEYLDRPAADGGAAGVVGDSDLGGPAPLARQLSLSSEALPFLQRAVELASKVADPTRTIELTRSGDGAFSVNIPFRVHVPDGPTTGLATDLRMYLRVRDLPTTRAFPQRPIKFNLATSATLFELLPGRSASMRVEGSAARDVSLVGVRLAAAIGLASRVAQQAARATHSLVQRAVLEDAGPGWLSLFVSQMQSHLLDVTMRLVAVTVEEARTKPRPQGRVTGAAAAAASSSSSSSSSPAAAAAASSDSKASGRAKAVKDSPVIKSARLRMRDVRGVHPTHLAAGFALQGTAFVHGGKHTMLRSAWLRTNYRIGHNDMLPLTSVSGASLRALDLPWSAVIDERDRLLPQEHLTEIIRARLPMRTDEAISLLCTGLASECKGNIEQVSSSTLALVEHADGTFEWLPVPLTSSSHRAPAGEGHVVCSLGGNVVVALIRKYDGSLSSVRGTLIRAPRTSPSGWMITWQASHDSKSALAVRGPGFAACKLPEGQKILVAGGRMSSAEDFLVVFDAHPARETWTRLAVSPLDDPRQSLYGHSVAIMASRYVVIYGGLRVPSNERIHTLCVYDLELSKWRSVKATSSSEVPPAPRAYHWCVSTTGVDGHATMLVYGGSAAGDSSLHSDMMKLVLHGADDHADLPYCWRLCELMDASRSQAAISVGTSTTSFVNRRSHAAAALIPGRAILFAGLGQAHDSTLPLGFKPDIPGIPTVSTVAFQVQSTSIRQAASTFAADILSLLDAGDGVPLVPGEVELEDPEGRTIRCHAALLIALCPFLRDDLVASAGQRHVAFSTDDWEDDDDAEADSPDEEPESLGVFPGLLRRRSSASSAAPPVADEIEVVLADWHSAADDSGPVLMSLDVASAMIQQVVRYAYVRAGTVSSEDAASVLEACRCFDLTPTAARTLAERHSWRWSGIAPGLKGAAEIVAAEDHHGFVVLVDLRLSRAAMDSMELRRPSAIAAAPGGKADASLSSGDAMLRKSLGLLLTGGATVSSRSLSAPTAAGASEDDEGGEDSDSRLEEHLLATLPKPSLFSLLGADCAVRISRRVVLPGHRAVLAARSPWFRGALLGGMSEATSGIVGIGVRAPVRAGLALMQYLYTDAAPLQMDAEIATELLPLAVLHMLPRLRTRCEAAIIAGFDLSDPESVVGIASFTLDLGSGVPQLSRIVGLSLARLSARMVARACRAVGIPEDRCDEILRFQSKFRLEE